MTVLIPLERDQKWSAFNEYTWESFQDTFLPKPDLIPAVNEEVRKQYRAIRKLMAYSFFEYEFFDVAAAQMSMLMEMAMAWKYEDVTGEPWKRKIKKGSPKRDLKNLFEWLKLNGHLDITHSINVDLLRSTRNYYAHPKKHGFGGGINLTRIKQLLFLINELYDTNLNVRNLLAKEFYSWVEKNRGHNIVKMHNLNFPLADLMLAFVDCSTETPVYFIICFPLLALDSIDQSSPNCPQTLVLIQLVNIEFHDKYITGVEAQSSTNITIESADSATCELIDQWHVDLGNMSGVSEQLSAWKSMQVFEIVTDLKTKYYNSFSETNSTSIK